MNILNLTQHSASAEQVEAGVIDVDSRSEEYARALRAELTFESIPTWREMRQKARAIAVIAELVFPYSAENPLEEKRVMIGGAPYLMARLETELRRAGFTPVYAFSERKSVEKTGCDGVVTKTMQFFHAGFIAADSRE